MKSATANVLKTIGIFVFLMFIFCLENYQNQEEFSNKFYLTSIVISLFCSITLAYTDRILFGKNN